MEANPDQGGFRKGNMKSKWSWFLLGALSAIIVTSGINFFTSYDRNVKSMLHTSVSYKDVHISTSLSSDACGYLADGRRQLYFGELPSKENAIEINSPRRATIYVYPLDEDSMIIEYNPRNGISRNYIKSGFGDFNRFLQVLYELTENQVFHKTVEY